MKVQQRGKITAYGGVSLAHDLAMRLQLDRDINRSIRLLKINVPYCESDHILTHVYNQYVGGHCIEDIANLQHSEAIKHLLGACRIPDPSTAGDFLRRFDEVHLHNFQAVIDRAREKVWRKMPRSRKKVGTVDLDSTIKEVYGPCKQGADFSYNGKWSYHPGFPRWVHNRWQMYLDKMSTLDIRESLRSGVDSLTKILGFPPM